MPIVQFIASMWPLAVVVMPFLLGAGFLWLKDKFPTKEVLQAAEDKLAAQIKESRTALTEKIDGTEKVLSNKIDEHEDRLDTGSRKMADLDKRVAVVEEDCRAMPSRQNLQIELSGLSQRVRGVEVWTEQTSKGLDTLNSYLHTLIERGLGGGGK